MADDMTAAIQQATKGIFPGTLGIEFVEVNSESVRARLEVTPAVCTSGEILHGGAIMALADTVGAVATVVNLPGGAGTTTLESKTNFLRAAKLGTTVTAEATALHRGRRTMVWQTRITGDQGKLVAVVTQTQMVLGGS
jgi:1,4-dihydroxy-2-naphthoyl-CoA hydrolase